MLFKRLSLKVASSFLLNNTKNAKKDFFIFKIIACFWQALLSLVIKNTKKDFSSNPPKKRVQKKRVQKKEDFSLKPPKKRASKKESFKKETH
ncbi:hypothetical protein [Helicobacter pylori]|uniref:hypothetical protein n=1 Tax=Helicobacter pylori TaxID=210 RepID=UPI0036F20AC0